MQITVGIATWNRQELLRQTLQSLTRVACPPGVEWELLVCDNNSSDETRPAVESFSGRLPVRYLFESEQGLGFAHNCIARAARGQWLMILDDDVQLDPQWMNGYVEAIGRYPRAGCLAGQVLPWLDRPARGQRAWLLEHYPWVHAVLKCDRDEQLVLGGPKMPHGPNMAVRRDVLAEIGGFDTGRGMIGTKRVGGEDTQIGVSVLEQGYEVWLVAGAKVDHYIPRRKTGFRWFCSWHTGTGYMWCLERGPAPAGRFGLRIWLWREIANRLGRALLRYRPGNPMPAYEMLSEACARYGYLRASR